MNGWVVVIIVICCFFFVGWVHRKIRRPSFSSKDHHHSTTQLMIVLGSGGHTTEMFSLLQQLPKNDYSPRIYIVANTDNFSVHKLREYENGAFDYHIEFIPRSRSVGQSYLRSIPSVVHAWFYSLAILYHYGGISSILLCNGPGTGVPLCLTAIVLRYIGALSIKVLFIESLARVHHLSLTGKILYPFVDRFLVQWPYLKTSYPHAEYYGILI
jgi:beta-1,4-N-acetylglucosaminyltransferase